MPKAALTGTRIREQRLMQGLGQAVLARRVGISAPYLNLIEHNRRRIAGKLLQDIARELGVDPVLLSQGAKSGLLSGLLDAAAAQEVPQRRVEVDLVDEFAGRFPGWANLLVRQRDRIDGLERTVAALSDRMAHDPQLAASLHEVLSVATAIRSTSAILARDDDLDPDWQGRFHRNLFEDARRLAESAQALVAYLNENETDPSDGQAGLPREELEAWLAQQNFHISALEGDGAATPEDVLTGQPQLTQSPATARLAQDYLHGYRDDAEQVPLAALVQSLADGKFDPITLAGQFGCDLACLFRRLASLPETGTFGPFGLAVCDSSGTLIFRKPLSGFFLPQFGAACTRLPLYQVLSRPLTPLCQVVEQSGHRPERFLTYSVAQPVGEATFNTPQMLQATMLILPEQQQEDVQQIPVVPIGPGCRICPREDCEARREPSILKSGF